ncbi:hypothetical protein VPH35_066407 [Triticum aestivum]|uniref:Uncharacterized protein n=1 Tax=Triticum turgidum subsp. durum TaxID=4567 RepID=A0A9R0W158_TRITD|nr:unnamed protein product [Triticum turgidum subsp. durum]
MGINTVCCSAMWSLHVSPWTSVARRFFHSGSGRLRFLEDNLPHGPKALLSTSHMATWENQVGIRFSCLDGESPQHELGNQSFSWFSMQQRRCGAISLKRTMQLQNCRRQEGC